MADDNSLSSKLAGYYNALIEKGTPPDLAYEIVLDAARQLHETIGIDDIAPAEVAANA